MENNSIDVSSNNLRNSRKNKTKSKIIKGFIYLMAFITLAVLFYLIIYMLINGIPHLKPSMFSNHYTSKNVSMMPSIKTTIMLVLLTLLIASPIGIFTAIYLSEYSKKNSKVVTLIRLATETLSGIPSIVYGLFGMLLFVMRLKFRYSLISGVLTMFIMVLPLIIRASEQALLSIDDELRAGSYALGAGKLYTIRKVLLPVAMPGIMAGIILSIGRVVGETAALMYTLGTATSLPASLKSSSRTLALHMYVLSSEGKHVGEAYATGMVLLLLVLLINWSSTKLADKLKEVE